MTEVEKNFIISESSNLEYNDMVQILVIVKRYGKEYIMEKSDGCRINLNKLPEEGVMQIYRFMKSIFDLDDDF